MMLKPRPSSRRAARSAVPVAAVLLGAVFALSTGCVSSGTYTSLDQERDALAGLNVALQGELSSAKE